MKLRLSDNLNQKTWDDFILASSKDGGFLQSWSWGEFQASAGRKIFRLAVLTETNEIIVAALAVKHQLPFGQNYFYLPRGPVLAKPIKNQPALKLLLTGISDLAQAERVIFLRLDPAEPVSDQLLALGFKPVGEVQPASTLILDLAIDEPKLLSQMKAKTRYNIKLAQKHGVTVSYSDKTSVDFELFWQLLLKTAKRDAIALHTKAYYQKMIALPQIKLVLAYDRDQVLAGAIAADFGQWRVYLHGASDYDFREKMAPYLLQWQMIIDAKATGRKFYDFWGANEKKWPGVTRFKTGFAPAIALIQYIGAYDLPLNKFWHRLYRLSKIFKLR